VIFGFAALHGAQVLDADLAGHTQHTFPVVEFLLQLVVDGLHQVFDLPAVVELFDERIFVLLLESLFLVFNHVELRFNNLFTQHAEVHCFLVRYLVHAFDLFHSVGKHLGVLFHPLLHFFQDFNEQLFILEKRH